MQNLKAMVLGNTQLDDIDISILRIVFFSMLLLSSQTGLDLFRHTQLNADLWNPQFGLVCLSEKPKSFDSICLVLFCLWKLFTVFALIGLKTRFTATVVAFLYYFLVSASYSYGSFGHTHSPIVIVCFLFIFSRSAEHLSIDSIFEKDQSRRFTLPTNFFILFIKTIFIFTFFNAGLSKLLLGNWIQVGHLQYYVFHSKRLFDVHDWTSLPKDIKSFLIQNKNAASLISLLIISFELAVPLVLVGKVFQKIIITGLFLMQLGGYLLFGLDFHLYLFLYLFFLPLKNMKLFFNGRPDDYKN